MLRLPIAVAAASFIAALALLFVTPSVINAADKPTCQTKECAIRVARKNCSNHRPTSCVRRAALHHRVKYRLLRRIGGCESSGAPGGKLRPRVSNPSGAGGMMQFMVGTFNSTPYGPRHSRYFAKWAALAAAWLIRHGSNGLGHWTASRHCWAG